MLRFLLVVFPVLSLCSCLLAYGLALLLASSYLVNPVCIFGCASNLHKEKKPIKGVETNATGIVVLLKVLNKGRHG